MIGNIVLFGFFGLLAWLLYSFILPKAEKKQDYKNLFFFFLAAGFFLAVNGLFAYLGMSGLSIAGSSDPIMDLKTIDQKQDGEGVVIFGNVSSKNQFITDKYAAYLDEFGLWSPDRLWVKLEDGEIAIDNDTYQPTNWQEDSQGRSFLPINGPITIVGLVKINQIDQSKLVEAEIIHAGSFESFVSRSKTKLGIATAMTIVNFIAVILLFVPIIKSIKGMRTSE
ncbi:MAG TPA: hypothetical protein VK856_15225 [Anaerolineaceae bacterium]|nr:hypothetical protein [Anaerolineaceae bacterium]